MQELKRGVSFRDELRLEIKLTAFLFEILRYIDRAKLRALYSSYIKSKIYKNTESRIFPTSKNNSTQVFSTANNSLRLNQQRYGINLN